MKKITSSKLQTALLRGAVTAFGCMTTICVALFLNDIYGVLTTLFLGAGMITLINSYIK